MTCNRISITEHGVLNSKPLNSFSQQVSEAEFLPWGLGVMYAAFSQRHAVSELVPPQHIFHCFSFLFFIYIYYLCRCLCCIKCIGFGGASLAALNEVSNYGECWYN